MMVVNDKGLKEAFGYNEPVHWMAMLIHHDMTLTAISPSPQIPYVPDRSF